MSYLFNTPGDRAAMLGAIGVDSVAALFDSIPEPFRRSGPLNLPPALAEPDLERHITRLARRNVALNDRICFLGGGSYDHFIPAVVDEIAGRGEFYTAYTPYQAEASQGTLQAFFEFQTMICQLTGLEVSNASLYEGATAASEAALLAARVTGRTGNVVVAGGVHPETRQVLATTLGGVGIALRTVPVEQGRVDPNRLADTLTDDTAAVLFQHPNFLGCLESAQELCDAARRAGALAVMIYDPLSLGLLRRPADYGADVAVAEGQSLGIPLQYGGPYLGLFSCREEYVRKMPGRLIGTTTDRRGQGCYVLGLQAREQHIRRGKATSNICTNQGLMALRATVYLATLGPEGLREAAELSLRKAQYAAERLTALPGLSRPFPAPCFKEFLIRADRPAETVLEQARRAGFDVGPALSRFPEAWRPADTTDGDFLVAVTERRTRADIDALAEALAA